MVDYEEAGRGSVVRGVDLHPEGVKIMSGGVAFECEAVYGVGSGDIEKEVSTRVGIQEGTHDSVPGFPVGVTAEEDEAVGECAMSVMVVPKGDILAKVDIVGRGVFNEGTVGSPVAADVVGIWKVGDGKDMIPGNTATAVGEDSLRVS